MGLARQRRVRRVCRLGWLVGLLLPCVALAADEGRALDLVYEAADTIDTARQQQRGGSQAEAERLLTQAERFLDEAQRLDPDLKRISFERARLLQADGDPERAEALLEFAMHGALEPGDHVLAVSILDDIGRDLGKPTAGARWERATLARDVGAATLAAGVLVAIAGFAGAFDSLAQDTYDRVSEPDLSKRQAGFALAGVGSGLALGGGITLAIGEGQRARLRLVLPGPWRLPGAPLEAGSTPKKKPKETESQGILR